MFELKKKGLTGISFHPSGQGSRSTVERKWENFLCINSVVGAQKVDKFRQWNGQESWHWIVLLHQLL